MAGRPGNLVHLSDYHGQARVSVDVQGRRGEGEERLRGGRTGTGKGEVEEALGKEEEGVEECSAKEERWWQR